MLNKQLLNELNVILKEDYGMELNPHELQDVGNDIVSFFDLLAKMDSENKKIN